MCAQIWFLKLKIIAMIAQIQEVFTIFKLGTTLIRKINYFLKILKFFFRTAINFFLKVYAATVSCLRHCEIKDKIHVLDFAFIFQIYNTRTDSLVNTRPMVQLYFILQNEAVIFIKIAHYKCFTLCSLHSMLLFF